MKLSTAEEGNADYRISVDTCPVGAFGIDERKTGFKQGIDSCVFSPVMARALRSSAEVCTAVLSECNALKLEQPSVNHPL
jgi:hypothetical protein